MSLPRITHNEDYDDAGGHVIRITAEIDHDELDRLHKIIDQSECVYVEEPNPHNRNGQPMKHTDNRTGEVHLTYYGKKVTDAFVGGANYGTRLPYLWIALENGDRKPYACGSKDEFEWIRKGLGQSSLDYHQFKV